MLRFFVCGSGEIAVLVAGEGHGVIGLGNCDSKQFLPHGDIRTGGVAALAGGFGNKVPVACVNIHITGGACTGGRSAVISKSAGQRDLPLEVIGTVVI